VTYSLDEYVDVAERIQLFYSKFPEGSLVTIRGPEAFHVGERTFVWCQAAAYRSPNDVHPAKGTAWEPIPGPTPFTRDSEAMNAETAAWGRAIVAVGIPSKKIASSDEVRARSGGDAAPPARSNGAGKRTDKQNKKLHVVLGKLDKEQPRPDGPWKDYAKEWTFAQFEKQSSTQLTEAECDDLIAHLETLLVPFS
jgi:hypothetical protein